MIEENLINQEDGGAQAPTSVGDLFYENRRKLRSRLKKRYAKAIRAFEVGVWSAKSPSHIFGIILGSIPGERNTYKYLKIDYNNLKRELKKLGLSFEDCMCAEQSPDSHEYRRRDGTMALSVGNLWHLHGCWKLPDVMGAAELHSVLAPLMGKIRGAEVVDVIVINTIEQYLKYTVKDALKRYCDDEKFSKRLLQSRHWYPVGYRRVEKLLKTWALYHGAGWPPDADFTNYGELLGEYVPFAWQVSRAYLKEWCRGFGLRLEIKSSIFYIQREFVNEFEEV